MKGFVFLVSLAFSTAVFAQNYGAPLTLEQPISVEQAIQTAGQQNAPVLVQGKIGSVCQAKGCWMGFTSTAGDIRVTFKDYGFFVPFSIVGKIAQAEGRVEKITLSLEDSKHLVADGGGDPKSVTEPIIEYQMIASGVHIE